MNQTAKNTTIPKRKLIIKMIGLGLIILGVAVSVLLVLTSSVTTFFIIVCVASVLLGLILAGSPDAWLEAIFGSFWG